MSLKETIWDQYTKEKSNQKWQNDDYKSYLDLLDNYRSEKEYDWMSDIRLPEFTTQHLTQAALDADQMFQTKDFTEVYLEDGSSKAAAAASKEGINRTLNQRHLYYFLKYMRAKAINHLNGDVYALAEWQQEFVDEDIVTEKLIETGEDEDGNPTYDIDLVEGTRQRLVKDRFNFDVYDPRNVVTNNAYVYSVQDKDWLTFRSETSYQKLVKLGYKKLDMFKDVDNGETETSKETFNEEEERTPEKISRDGKFDLLKRFGKAWVIVLERDDNEFPTKVEDGLDDNDLPKEKAEYIEVFIDMIVSGSTREIIRLEPNNYRTPEGETYRPCWRGICYIHPSKDAGFGDGQNSKELQIAIDDTFNAAQDATIMQTFPTFTTKRHSYTDNTELYFEPMHAIPIEEDGDIKQLQFKADTGAAINQINYLTGSMHQANAIQPPQMGVQIKGVTATGVADASQNSSKRTNLKSKTFEYTFLAELYWMIQMMTHQFATEETAMKLFGDKVQDFDPSLNYTYKAVSQSIETEYSTNNKLTRLDNMLNRVASVPNPKTAVLLNLILKKMFTLMGDEAEDFNNALFDESVPISGPDNGEKPGEVPVSNQFGHPQSNAEALVRNA